MSTPPDPHPHSTYDALASRKDPLLQEQALWAHAARQAARLESMMGNNETKGNEMATDARLTFSTRIDLSAEVRGELVELLNARLADAFDLYSQLKQAHWNVKGSDFIQLHALYDTVAADVIDFVDLIAERATALGGLALGTARLAASASSLDEYPLDAVAGRDTVSVVADRLAGFGGAVRAGIDMAAELGDQATADLLTEVSRATDKHLWFVEAHLQT